MKSLRNIFVLFLALVFAQCSQSPKCWGKDKNEGIVESCPEINVYREGQFVINSEQEFKNKIDSLYVLPSIDFSKYTLLGLSATFGCNAKFIREVKKNDAESKYEYKLTVRECGACKRLGMSVNWVLVPKLPQGWTVDFSVKKR